MASVTANTTTDTTLNDLWHTGRPDFSKNFIESWSTTPSFFRDIYRRCAKKTSNPTGRAYEWNVELGTPTGITRRAFDTAPAVTGQTPNLNVGARQDIATYEYLLEMTHDRFNLIKGQGSKVLVNTVEQLVKNAGKSVRDVINKDMIQQTTSQTDGVISIIASLAATPTTGTIHNINRATYSDWRNTTTTTGGAFATVGYNQLRSTFLAGSKGDGDEEADLIVSDDAIFNAWWALNDSRDNFWLDEDEEGKTVRRALKFLNAKWCWDHAYANATTIRGVCSKHIEMNVIGEAGKDDDKMGVTLGDWATAYNADKSAAMIKWQGALKFFAFKYCWQISGLTA